MENKELFVTNLEECANERFKIEEGVKENVKQLKKLFKKLTNFGGKYFNMLSNFAYYQGGYPNEDSKPKIIDFMDQLGVAFSVYSLTGKEATFNDYLSTTYGIKIIEIEEGEIASRLNKAVNDTEISETYQRYTLQNDKPNDVAGYLKGIIRESTNLQSQICDANDLVTAKATNTEEVCKIQKSNFMKSVALKVKQMIKGKDEVREDIKKLHTDFTNLNEALEPLA